MNVLPVLVRRIAPMLLALTLDAWMFSFAPAHAIGPPWMLVLLGVGACFWVLWQPLAMRRDDLLPALAMVLSGLGVMMVARLSPQLAQRQLLWLAVSLVLAIGAGPFFSSVRRVANVKYIWVLLSLILFALVVVFGREVNGAKLWIVVGPVRYEPVELIKLCIVFFLAAYLSETGDVIAMTRPWSLRENAKYLGPLLLGWGPSLIILILQHDIGMAALLLAVFASMLYAATRRVDLVLGGLAVFALCAWFALHRYGYVQTRVLVWLHPFADPLGRGYQSAQAYFSLAAGGLFGTGYRLGHPEFIPNVANDYIYAAFSEEFGALGGIVLLWLFGAIAFRMFAISASQRDLFSKFLALGLGATLAFQTVVITGGVVGLFPLTGITLPFVSYGGSSLLANFLLVALVWAISARPVTWSRESSAS